MQPSESAKRCYGFRELPVTQDAGLQALETETASQRTDDQCQESQHPNDKIDPVLHQERDDDIFRTSDTASQFFVQLCRAEPANQRHYS